MSEITPATDSAPMTLVKRMLGVIKATPKADLDALLADTAVIKGTGPVHALVDSPVLRDLTTEGELHRVIPAKDLNAAARPTGASGAFWEQMYREYSNMAPQMGAAQEATMLGRMIGGMAMTMKAFETRQQLLGSTLLAQHQTMEAIKAALEAAVKAEEKEEETEDEETKKAAKAASAALTKARDLLAKAAECKQDADDMEAGAARKAKRAESVELRKSAIKALKRARLMALVGRKSATDIAKSITTLVSSDLVLKAEMEKEEEGDYEDEGEMEKAKSEAARIIAAAKAEADGIIGAAKKGEEKEDKGNQADRQNPENHNQEDAAKSDAMLAGLSMQIKSLQQTFDTIKSGARQGQVIRPDAFALLKANPASTIDTLAQKLQETIDANGLDAHEGTRARTLLQRFDAVIKGAIPQHVFLGELEMAPTPVHELFKAHLNAAAAA